MAPASNVQTGAATSIAEHPIGLLTRLRFRVTVNAMKSAFLPFDERLAIIDGIIKPGYAALGAD
jgi:adenosine deaminase